MEDKECIYMKESPRTCPQCFQGLINNYQTKQHIQKCQKLTTCASDPNCVDFYFDKMFPVHEDAVDFVKQLASEE